VAVNPSQLFDLGSLEALVAGVAVGGGLALFIAALVGFTEREPDPNSLTASLEKMLTESLGRLAVSGVIGILVALLTGWPVAGIAVAGLIFFWEKLFGGAAGERLAAQRIEALAMWTESLRDTIAGAVGLEQAIPSSTRAASPVLRPHLNTLIDRLRARMPLPDALQYLADDIDDPAADLVISALMLNAKLRGPGLREVLSALAKSAREEVDMRQRVMADRAGTRRSVQIIVVVVCVVVLGVALLGGKFVKPYDSAVGQLVLVVIVALFAAGFWWMRRLANVETPSRLLVRRSVGEQRAAEGMFPGPQSMSPRSMAEQPVSTPPPMPSSRPMPTSRTMPTSGPMAGPGPVSGTMAGSAPGSMSRPMSRPAPASPQSMFPRAKPPQPRPPQPMPPQPMPPRATPPHWTPPGSTPPTPTPPSPAPPSPMSSSPVSPSPVSPDSAPSDSPTPLDDSASPPSTSPGGS
jgi:Flp pilus assembly protein TadB